MKDEKTKQKEEELIKMVSSFCKDCLDDEYRQLCVKLVQKLGRKREVPFRRGKLENWASGVIYAIGQINFLFDKSFEPYASADDICNYFNTKKSTAANKARDIRSLVNLKQYDKEFSTEILSEIKVSKSTPLGSVKTLRGAEMRGRYAYVNAMEHCLNYYDQKDFKNALKYVNKALNTKKDDETALYLKSKILFELGEINESMEIMKRI